MEKQSAEVDFTIWLDLRFLDLKDKYSVFVAILLQKLLSLDTNNKYKLYLSDKAKMKFNNNIDVEYISSKPWSLKEQINFYNILKKDENNLMIFFNEKKPLFYKWKYILFIKDLKEIHYKKETWKIEEYLNSLFFDSALKNATRIVCFDSQTKHELNEKLNVQDEIISVIYPFFNKKEINDIDLISNVKVKYSINWDFFVYSGWYGNNKNLSKLITVFQKLNKSWKDISLVILNKEVTEDVVFRNEVIQAGIVEKVLFIWETTLDEKKSFYNEAIWSIFPSLYESFPFELTESISYESPILASSIKQIKEIMQDDIAYFSPVSVIDMIEAIETFVQNWKQETKYIKLFERLNPDNSAQKLLELIKKI